MTRRSEEETRSSDERFRELIDSLPQLVWTCDGEGRCDYLSLQWVRYTGLPEEAQLGYGWLDFVHVEDRPELMRKWSASVETKTPFAVEFRLKRQDGEYRWFDTRATPMLDAHGRVVKWFGSNTDITEQRQVSAALRTSEERLQTVIANMTEGLVLCDLNGQILHWNPAGLAMHDFDSMDDCLLMLPEFQRVFELFTLDGERVPFERWPLPRIFRGEALSSLELRIRRIDRTWERCFVYNGAIVREPSGTRVAFLTISDRSVSKRAEAALKESEERLRIANEAAGIGTFDADLVTGHAKFSPEMCEILGVPPDTSLSLEGTIALVHPDDRSAFERTLTGAGGEHGRSRLELRIERPDGEMRRVSFSGHTFFEQRADGLAPRRTVGACVDLTERLRAERRLATQNGVSRALADAATLSEATPKIMQALCESEGWALGAIWQVDPQSNQLRCAEVWHQDDAAIETLAAATRGLEFEYGVGLPGRVWAEKAPIFIADVASDPSYLRAEWVVRAGLRSALAFPILERDEVTGVIDFVGPATGRHAAIPLDLFMLVGRQVGLFFERKRSEAERERLATRLRQSQKMEALGQLSGGIAHDFNNILSALVGNTQLAQSMVSPNDPISELLQEMAAANRRAVDLVKQILAFSRQQPIERRVIALASVMEESARLLRATLPAGIELTLSATDDVPPILADPTQVHQVVVNLATNAWHAIDRDSGRIELAVDAAELDASSRTLSEVRPGRYARLVVRDNGKGIDAATMERIFEPFFTTKSTGQGTGLGLSVVHGIMQDHEGTIQVESTVGKGSEFMLYFPAADGNEISLTKSIAPPRSGHGEHVMYVDDERALVKVVEQSLVELGYRVTTFTRPGHALDAFRSAPSLFSLIISDMNMPGVSGLSFVEQVRSIRPDVPTILISGHIPETLKTRAAELGVRRLLYKPCSLDELSEAVHEALNA